MTDPQTLNEKYLKNCSSVEVIQRSPQVLETIVCDFHQDFLVSHLHALHSKNEARPSLLFSDEEPCKNFYPCVAARAALPAKIQLPVSCGICGWAFVITVLFLCENYGKRNERESAKEGGIAKQENGLKKQPVQLCAT